MKFVLLLLFVLISSNSSFAHLPNVPTRVLTGIVMSQKLETGYSVYPYWTWNLNYACIDAKTGRPITGYLNCCCEDGNGYTFEAPTYKWTCSFGGWMLCNPPEGCYTREMDCVNYCAPCRT